MKLKFKNDNQLKFIGIQNIKVKKITENRYIINMTQIKIF